MTVHPVLRFSEILTVLHEEGKLDDAAFQMVTDYLKG